MTQKTLLKPAMLLLDLVGYCAAVLTTAAFVPQAWHTFQTKDVRGISLGMYSAFTAGISLWPIVVANAVTLSLAAAILAMKLRYR
jgi:MtN3 and saliva related transmembrane protein